MDKTEFHVEKILIDNMEKHPNADTLSIINVNGYPVIVRTSDFKIGDYAIYIPVDAIVPTNRNEFKFLAKGDKTTHRIKAIRLRQIFSMGLLLPFKKEYENVKDFAEYLGITKYIPAQELALEQGAQDKARKAYTGISLPVYGLDPLRRHSDALQEGEVVVLTEKIHGTNSRYCFTKGKLWVGSHKTMRGCTRNYLSEFFNRIYLKIKTILGFKHRAHLIADNGDVWWKVANKYNLKDKLSKYPDYILYGEIYGKGIQDLTYGDTELGFRAFDVYSLNEKKFLDFEDFIGFCRDLKIETVPILGIKKWSKETEELVKKLAEGQSYLADQLIEGVVIKAYKERIDPRIGRVALKYVGQNYLLR